MTTSFNTVKEACKITLLAQEKKEAVLPEIVQI